MVAAPPTQTLQDFAEELDKRITTELTKRGVKVYNVLTRIVDVDSSVVHYVTEVVAIVKEVMSVYYDALYDSCQEAIGLSEDPDGIDEEGVEKLVEECVGNELAELDYEYGRPPFRFQYKDDLFSARLDTVVDDSAVRRTYYDVLILRYENQCSSEYVGCGIDYVARLIVDKVVQLLNALKALMDT